MLRGLSIRDMLLVDRLDLAFEPGLNVLTGETGAGKSILLDSLGFVLGWKVPGIALRAAAENGEVTAEFDPPADDDTRAALAEAGIGVDDGVFLRRALSATGRRQAWINDRRVSADTLRRVAAPLVEMHGQHDDRGLLNATGHRALLDRFAAHPGLVEACRAAWRDWRAQASALAARRDEIARAAQDRDFLAHALAELEALAPESGEADRLDAARRAMKAGEAIREDVARAAEALGPGGAEGLVANALRWLESVAGRAEGRLDGALQALSEGFENLAGAGREIDDYLRDMAADPAEIERLEERLFAIRALARKHGVMPDDLDGLGHEMRRRLSALESAEATLEQEEAALAARQTAYRETAARLAASRREAAARLDQAMRRELPPLKLERARFRTALAAADEGPEGTETLRFTVATNPGTPEGPLDRIASGGELSRFLLALRVCLRSTSGGHTMIFDEIDRGVGGATADAVGRRLATLANGSQVLVVTHSPQVAARARYHWRVEKTETGGETLSTVAALDPAARAAEIARMLAGEDITDEAVAAAEALLAAAT